MPLDMPGRPIHPEWPLFAYVAFMPLCTLAAYSHSNHDASRIAQLAVMVIGCCLLLLHWAMQGRRTSVLSQPWALMLAALGAASVAGAAVPGMALREVALIVGLLVMFASAEEAFTAHGTGPASAVVLLGSGLHALCMVGFVAASAIQGEPIVFDALAVGYDNYRFLNHVQTIAIPLLGLIIGIPTVSAPARGLAWFALAVHWAYVLSSGARGTALAIVAGMVAVVAVLGWRSAKPFIRTMTVGLMAGTVVYVTVFHLLPLLGWLHLGSPAERAAGSLTSDSARLQLWKVAIDQIRSAPWLGVGPMHYAHYPNPKAAHPHNVYLQVAAEWGIPMTLALLVLVAKGFSHLRCAVHNTSDPTSRAQGVALFATCVAILADGFVSGNFVMPVSQMWIALALAWAVAWARQHRPAMPAWPSPVRQWAAPAWTLAAIALALQLWLVADVWHEATDLDAYFQRIHRDVVLNARTNPRFWSDGWF